MELGLLPTTLQLEGLWMYRATIIAHYRMTLGRVRR